MPIQRSVVIRLVADVNGMSAGMDEAERSVTRLDRRVASMTRAVRAAAAESAQASERVAAAKRLEESMASKAAAAEERAAAVRSAAAQASTRVGEAEARLADVRAAGTSEMASRVTAAEQRVTSVRRQAETAAARVGQAEERLAELRAGGANASASELSAAERRVEQARATAAAAAERVGQAEARLSELRAAESATAAEVAAAERRVEAARAQHNAVTNAATTAEERFAAAQEVAARASAQVTAAEERATAATNAHAAAASRSIGRTQAWNAAAGKMAMIGGTLGVGLGLAVKQYLDFDEAMSGVRANLSGTPAEMAQVTASVRQAGAASVFSAVEAANAAEELAKAGLSAAEITGGALTGSMDLAAAGGVGLGRAAEVAATAMAQFHLKGKDVAHIADVMAAGALVSTASIESLAQGMAQGGGMAASLGMSLEQTVGTLSLFDQNALKGSDGGTSLKTMLMSLTPNSKQAAAAMEEIGLKAFDANGKFVGLTTVAQQLADGTKKMGDEQRIAALKTIFGNDAYRAANVLREQGAKGLQDYIDKVSRSGVAAQVAAAKLNNAKGDLEKLKGDLQDVAIGAGEGANAPIRGLIQNVDKLVSAFQALPNGVKSGIFQIAAFGSAGLLAAAGVIKMVNTIRSIRSGFGSMATNVRDAAGAFRTWATSGQQGVSIMQGLRQRATQLASSMRNMGTAGKAGLALLAAGLVGAGIAAATAGPQIENFGRSSADLASDMQSAMDGGKGLNNVFSNLQIAGARDQSLSFADGMKQLGSSMNGVDRASDGVLKAIPVLGGALHGANGAAEAVKERLKGMGSELANLVQSGHADVAAKQFQVMAEEAGKQGVSTDRLMKLMPEYSDALARAATEQKQNAEASKQSALESVKAGNATEDQKKQVEDLAKAYKELNNALLEQRGGARGYQAAMDSATDALKENGATLDITTEKGRKNQEALDGIASSAGEWASSVLKSTGDQQQANAILEDGRQQYIKMAEAMGMSAPQAEKLADELIKIDGVNTVDVKVDGIAAASFGVNKLGEEVARLKGSKIEIPADTPNAPQVLQTLTALGLTAKQLSSDGTKVSIPTEALRAPETRQAIMGIKGATKDAQGNVTIPTSALSADATRNALKQIDNIAVQADGRVVTIPASTPNAAAVKALLEGVSGAALSADAKTVNIPVSSPNSPATKRLLNQVEGAALSADKKSVTVPTSALGAVTAKDEIDGVIQSANAADGKVARVSIVTTKTLVNEVINRGSSSTAIGVVKARGGVMFGDHEAFARGGVREDHEPQIARPTPGRVRVWAEPETQGEAYIPFANDGRRTRAKSITEYVARRFGGSVTWHADGSADDWSPDMSGIMAYANSLKVDPSALTEQRKKVADQNTALNKAIRDLKAAQAGLKGKSGAARVKAENAVATAIERQAKAQRELNDGKAKLNKMSAGAGADMTTRFMLGTTSQNGVSKRFLDNIERIRKRGFPRLARSLLEQGDSDAQAIAQTLSGGALSRLKDADKGLQASDALADRKSKLLDDLKGITTGGLSATAQQQANAQLISLQAANQRVAMSSGVVKVQMPTAQQIAAEMVGKVQVHLPEQLVVHSHIDGAQAGRTVTKWQDTQASTGSVMPGLKI